MVIMVKRLLIHSLFILILGSIPYSACAGDGFSYTTIEYPGAAITSVWDISGNNIVGYYYNGLYHGFLYNISTNTFTTLDYPGAVDTQPRTIDGNNIVGLYMNDDYSGTGFLYNISTNTYSSLGNLAIMFTPEGISGDNIVGPCGDVYGNVHGILYNISTNTYIIFDHPDAAGHTVPWGIDGNNIVGDYADANGVYHGFLYNASTNTYTTLDAPNAFGDTEAWGIDGNIIVGNYWDAKAVIHGFVYNISTNTYTTLEPPTAYDITYAWGVSGSIIVGEFLGGGWHEFFAVDTAPPTVTAFSISKTSTSLMVSITALQATDNVGVTGYMVTSSFSAPSADSSGWSTTPPTSFTFPSTVDPGTKTLYAWAKDAAGNVSKPLSATVALSDKVKPIVTGFTIASSSTSTTVSITNFTATDDFAVTGYMITSSFLPPSANSSKWSATPPTSFTFSNTTKSGTKTLYAWAKDSAGNVSKPLSAKVALSLDMTKPVVTGFSVASPSTSTIVSITSFTATDNVGVTGYMVTGSFLPPSANSSKWSATPPTSFTFPSITKSGTKTLYAWAKDAAGNVSKPLSAKVTINLPSVPR